MANIFRLPLINRIHSRPPLTEGGPQPNRLLDLLHDPNIPRSFDFPNPILRVHRYRPYHHRPDLAPSVVVATQPIAYDWPNPVLKKLPTSLWDYQQSYTVNLPLVSATALPFSQEDWPLPRFAPYVQQNPIQRLPPTTGIDQFFDAPGIAPTYDWPNPRGYAYPTSLRTWAQDLVSSKLSTLVPVPFFGQPFENPIRPDAYRMARGGHDVLKINLLGQDTFFTTMGQGPCYDWPNPRGYPYPVQLRSFHQVVNTLAGTPFSQDDFPNPVLPKYPMDLRTFLQGYENFMVTGTKPFKMNDYPNPGRYRHPIDHRTWLQSYLLTLIGQDQFYGAAGETKTYDYTNPLIKKAVHAVYDPNLGFFINLVPPPPAIGTISFRKTFSVTGTGVGKRQRRKDA